MAQKTDFIVERGLQVNTQITVANTLIISANGFEVDGVTVFDANGAVDFGRLTNVPDPKITVSLTGDVAGSGNATLTDLADGTISINAELSDTGVVANTYGSSSLIPVITVDVDGRVTSMTTVQVGGDSVADFEYATSNGQLIITTADGSTFAANLDLDAFSTTDLAEGDNQYYTIARANSAIDARVTKAFVEALGISHTSLTDVPDPTIDVTLSGDVAGSGSATLTDLANGSISITTTIQADSVALGTDTTGDYVQSATGGTGVTITGGTGEGSTPEISIGQAVGTTDNVTFNDVTVNGTLYSNDVTASEVTITGNLVVNGTTTTVNSTEVNVGDAVLNLNSGLDGGTAPSVDGGFSINRGSSANVSLLWDETNDYWTVGSEEFVAGTFTGDLTGNVTGDVTGNADTATALATARTIALTGDVAGSVSFDGTANVTITAELSNTGVTADTYGSSAAIPVITVDEDGRVTNVATVSVGGVDSFTYDSSNAELIIGTSDGSSVSATIDLNAFSTTNLAEGTNQYYTDARARNAISVSGDLAYNSTTGVVSFTERTDAEVRGLISADGDLSYNSTTGVISFTERTDAEVRALLSAAGDLSYDANTGEFSVTTYKSADFDTDFSGKTTTDLTEGTNQYYTVARANTAIDNRVTKAFVEGLAISHTSLTDVPDPTVSVTLSGDVAGTGSATLTDLANGSIAITATIQENSVALGTDTTGDYVDSLVAGTGVTLSNNSGEGATPTIAIGQDVGTSANVTFNDGDFQGDLIVEGNLIVNGNTVTTNVTQLDIEDNIVHIASNNAADTVDFGWVGHYIDGTANSNHAGIFRDATDSEFYIFDQYSKDEVTGATIDRADPSFSLARVNADTFIGDLEGNANTASALETARTIALSGDVSGSVSFDGSANVTITATVAADSHNHTVSTITDFGTATNTAIDNRVTKAFVDNLGVDSDTLDGQEGSYYLDFTNATNKPDPTITLSGDVTGSVTLTDLANGTITTTVGDDSHNHTVSTITDFGTATNTAIDNRVTKAFVEGLAISHTSLTDVPDPTVSVSLSGDVTGSGSATLTDLANGSISITAELSNTGVVANTYGSSASIPVITVDEDGRVTNVATVSVGGVDSFTYDSANADLIIGTSDGSSLTATIDLNAFSTTDLAEGDNQYYTEARANTAIDNRVTKSFVEGLGISHTSLTDVPDPTITVTLSGDVAGSASATLTDLANGNIAITTTVQADSVALGTDTTGDYVENLTSGTGVTVTNNSGEGSSPTIAIGQDVSTTANVTFNDVTVNGTLYSNDVTASEVTITGNLVVNGTTTTVNSTEVNIGDAILNLNSGLDAGTGPSVDGGISINRGSSANVSLVWDETNDYWTVGTETFVAGTFTGNLTGDVTGNADTATALETSRTIELTGDVTGSASFDGTANASITATVGDDSHNHTVSTITDFEAEANSAIDARVTKAFVDNLGVDADTLDGQEGSYYLDFTNATNKPDPTVSVSLSGDIAGTGSATLTDLANGSISITTELSDTGVVANTYGSASQVPVITVDADGRVTNASSVSVAGVDSFTYDSSNAVLTIGTADGGSFDATIDLNAFSTTDLTEGTNQYYTVARANTAIDNRVTKSFVDNLGVDADTLDGQEGTYYLDFTNATNKPDPTIDVTLSGDIAGSGSATLTDLANGSISITTTIQANSVALGTDTTGDYVESLTSGTGVTITNNSGEGATPTIAIGQDVSTTANVTFNDVTVDGSLYSNDITASEVTITGNLVVNGTTTTVNSTEVNVGDAVLNLNSGLDGATAPSIDGGFSINRGSSANVSLLWDETNDYWTVGSETFVAGTFQGDLTGNANTATALETARTIEITGDAAGNTTFDGTGDATITLTIADDSHNHSNSTGDFEVGGALTVANGGITLTTESKITGVAFPTDDTDVATKKYVDDSIEFSFGADTVIISSNAVAYTATEGQTVFVLPEPTDNEDHIFVAINGVHQFANTYTHDPATDTITLDEGVDAGDEIDIRVFTRRDKGIITSFITTDNFTANGTQTAFTTSQAIAGDEYAMVYINGIKQFDSEYSTSGSTVTFNTAPTNGDEIEIKVFDDEVTDTDGNTLGSLVDSKFFNGDGSTDTFSFDYNITADAGAFLISINGVRQATDTYTVDKVTNTVTFDAPPSNGQTVELRLIQGIPSAEGVDLVSSKALVEKSTTIVANTATTIDSFSAVAYRSAKFIIQLSHDDTDFEFSEANVLHDGNAAFVSQYGIVNNNGSLGTVDAQVTGGNVNLIVTPAQGNTRVRVIRTSIAV